MPKSEYLFINNQRLNLFKVFISETLDSNVINIRFKYLTYKYLLFINNFSALCKCKHRCSL